jgi:hypothetical protein
MSPEEPLILGLRFLPNTFLRNEEVMDRRIIVFLFNP